jgi:hypothetical protein
LSWEVETRLGRNENIRGKDYKWDDTVNFWARIWEGGFLTGFFSFSILKIYRGLPLLKELCCSLNKYIRFYYVCISFVQLFIDMRRLIRIVYALFCICNEITLYIVVSILYRTQELGPLYWMVTRWQIPCKWEQVRRTYLLGPTNWKAVRKCSNCKSLNLEFQFCKMKLCSFSLHNVCI